MHFLMKTSALGALAVDALLLPAAVSAVKAGTGPYVVPGSGSCGCSAHAAHLSVSQAGMAATVRQAASPLPDTGVPKCADVVGPTCTEQFGQITWCVRYDVNTCHTWSHPVKIWYCPGATYYSCYDKWSDTMATCTVNCSATLPPGCPGPNGWTECD